jgi:hypothetical protein
VGKLPNQSGSRYHGLPIVDIADITYSRDMLWGISPGIRGAAERLCPHRADDLGDALPFELRFDGRKGVHKTPMS